MATSGPNSPGTLASDNSNGGVVAWAMPSLAGASDNAYAVATLNGDIELTDSELLKATNFGFAIPDGSTINGIVVEVERVASDFTVSDGAVFIVKGGTINDGYDLSDGGWDTSEEVKTYGSPTELWGLSWSASDINSSGFGVAISANSIQVGTHTASVDHIRVTIYYTAPVNPVFGAASNSGYQAAQSTYSWSHTCTGTNRFLSVDVEMLSVPGTTVTGITYNSVALTLIGVKSTVSGAGRVECWGLIAPATGSHTIAVTLSASVASAATAVSRTAVHQTVPTEAFNSAQATNVGAANAAVTITSIADNSVIHVACASDDTAITAGQTTRNNVTGAGGSGANEDTGPVSPAGGSAMTYTNVGALATWAIAGYAVRSVAASSGGTVPAKMNNSRRRRI